MSEQDIKDMAESEIERFKLEAENKLLESQGLVREATQCVKSTEFMFTDIKEQVAEMSNKFSAIKKWLFGTNGNTVNEDDIHESFIVRFKNVEDYIRSHKPLYVRAWEWAKAYPKTAIFSVLMILNALGFSTAGIMSFIHKMAIAAAKIDEAIPK